MTAKHLLLASAIAGVLAFSPRAMAIETSDLNSATPPAEMSAPATNSDLSLSPTIGAKSDKSDDSTTTSDDTKYLDTAASDEPNIHGFANVTFTSSYTTPRGLVVADDDLVMQPIVGLVFPLGDIGPLKNFTFVGGIWNCITFVQHDPHVGPWNELDDFFSVSFDVLPNLNANLTYVSFNSPNGAFSTENNADLYLSYNDSSFWGGNFGLHPYADLWWAINGDSTVVNGKSGHTGYAQLGLVPTYTWKVIPQYPITFKVPAYISVGPKDYWSVDGAPTGGTFGDGNIGVYTIGLDVGIPLAFIPTKYGYWHADAGVTYFDFVNNALLDAGTIVSGNTRRDYFVGQVTVGVSF